MAGLPNLKFLNLGEGVNEKQIINRVSPSALRGLAVPCVEENLLQSLSNLKYLEIKL